MLYLWPWNYQSEKWNVQESFKILLKYSRIMQTSIYVIADFFPEKIYLILDKIWKKNNGVKL